MIPATTKGREVAPEGTFVARITSLIHIGTTEKEWQGDKYLSNEARIGFELPTEELHELKEGEGEKPFVVSQDFTLSLGNKSKLRPLVKGALGFTDEKMSEIEKGMEIYDVSDILGKAVQVVLIHKVSKKGNKYVKIDQITGLIKGIEVPEQVNPSFLLDYTNFDDAKFNNLPEFIQDKMKTSVEYKALKGLNEDVPFDSKEDVENGLLEGLHAPNGN